eukprot:CAMPEP_0184740678 /NCGR_PEP_ID=MMETSP0315-20130426/3694_1 /TAXON_ID=101924 /ORGANISM="Rhodosorus marinus, Strain UTEX LB 2760" /LENGTH=53 /DNA_ID=CAMNT_0027210497 /DNA_START=201 /DNA_END=358 /DNA_ORIENTATION=+
MPAQVELLLEGDFESLWTSISVQRTCAHGPAPGTRTTRSQFSSRRVLHQAKNR